jgi:cell division protein FtsB
MRDPNGTPMATRQRKSSFLGKLVLPAVLVAVLAYFAYHLVNGDLGMRARELMAAEKKALQQTHAALVAERKHLEARVQLLRPEKIDPDLADERARLQLGYAHPDEIVVFRGSERAALPVASIGNSQDASFLSR